MVQLARQRANKKRKGFTLVELIVVIGILLTLSILAIIAYSNWRTEAHRAAVSHDANALCRAANVYNSIAPDSAKIKDVATLTSMFDATTNAYTLTLLKADSGLSEDKLFTVTIPADRVDEVEDWLSMEGELFIAEEPTGP